MLFLQSMLVRTASCPPSKLTQVCPPAQRADVETPLKCTGVYGEVANSHIQEPSGNTAVLPHLHGGAGNCGRARGETSRCDAVGSVRALGARCRRFKSCHLDQYAPVAEMVDVADLESASGNGVGVQIPPGAPVRTWTQKNHLRGTTHFRVCVWLWGYPTRPNAGIA